MNERVDAVQEVEASPVEVPLKVTGVPFVSYTVTSNALSEAFAVVER